MSFNPVQGVDYTLLTGISSSATSMTLPTFEDIDGTPLTLANFGTSGTLTIDPDTDDEENVSFTAVSGTSPVTISSMARGLSPVYPYAANPSLAKAHLAGATVRITNNTTFYNKFSIKENTETISGDKTFTGVLVVQAPSTGSNPTTKTYVDDAIASVVAGGAVDASTTVKGIVKMSVVPLSPTNPIAVSDNDPRMLTSDQAAAAAGTSGTPSGTNKYVTNDDTEGTGKVLRESYLPNFFGNGADGDVTIASGTTTLTKDMYYNNLTLSTGAILNPAGYRIFVKGTLTRNGTGKISRTGNAGGNGSNGVAGVLGVSNGAGGGAGAASVALTSGTVYGGAAGSAGGAGSAGVTNGASSAAGNASAATNASGVITGGGNGSAGGNGGTGGAVAGTAGAGTSGTATLFQTTLAHLLQTYSNVVQIGTSSEYAKSSAGSGGGGGGAGGSGNTLNIGAGGGGGGGGAGSDSGNMLICAKTILDNNVGVTLFELVGGAGGTGGNGGNGGGFIGGGGGGGGGAGGNSGIVQLLYFSKNGTITTSLTGGVGGTGGTAGGGGVPAATAGANGANGRAGIYVELSLIA